MGEGHIIKTPLDALLSALQEATSPLSAGRLSTICSMPEREVLKWEEDRLKRSLKQARKLMGTESLTLSLG